MAEESRPWPGTTVGDAGPYSDDDWDDIREAQCGSGLAPYNNRGVIRNWLNELEVTDGGANTADVDTGAALVHGKDYFHTAPVINLNIPNSVGAWREDLVCLRSDWTLQTIRIFRHANPADTVAYPAPTQNDGVEWEIPLAAVRINAAGVITLITDLRDYVSDLLQPKQLQVMPKNDDGLDAVVSYHSGVRLSLGEMCNFEFMVPLDFTGLVAVYLRFVPYTTGSVTYSAWMRAGACGELLTTVQDSIITAVAAVTQNIVECEDVTAGFAGLAAGDQVGFTVRNDNVVGDEDIMVVQLDFRYA